MLYFFFFFCRCLFSLCFFFFISNHDSHTTTTTTLWWILIGIHDLPELKQKKKSLALVFIFISWFYFFFWNFSWINELSLAWPSTAISARVFIFIFNSTPSSTLLYDLFSILALNYWDGKNGMFLKLSYWYTCTSSLNQ